MLGVVLKRGEEAIDLALVDAPLRKQDAQPRVFNRDGARGVLHLQRGFDALLFVLV